MTHTIGAETDVEAIRTLRAELERADVERDLEGYLARCTDDLVLMPPGNPPVVGREDVRAFLQGVHEEGGEMLDLQHRSHALVVRGEQGFDQGIVAVESRATDGEIRERSFGYVDFYRLNAGGAWRYDGGGWFPLD